MKKLIRNNIGFVTVYLIFALSIILLISYLGKDGAQLWANQFHSAFFDHFFFWSTRIVEWFSLIIFIGLLLFKTPKYAITGILIYGITALLVRLLKVFVFTNAKRPTFFNNDYRLLPDSFDMHQLSSNSFPSGHTTAAFALFCFLAIITNNNKLKVFYGIVACVVGYSRIYLSQHYFEDVLTGATIGTFLTFFLYSLFDKINYGAWAYKPLISLKK